MCVCVGGVYAVCLLEILTSGKIPYTLLIVHTPMYLCIACVCVLGGGGICSVSSRNPYILENSLQFTNYCTHTNVPMHCLCVCWEGGICSVSSRNPYIWQNSLHFTNCTHTSVHIHVCVTVCVF